MKKQRIRKVIFTFLLFLVVGCGYANAKRLKVQGIQLISYQELQKYLNDDVEFMLYIGRSDCGDCIEFYPILEDYINTHDHTGIYDLDIKEFRDRAKDEHATDEEKEFYEHIREELSFQWTPTLHIISNGNIIDSYQYLDENYYQLKDKEKQAQTKQKFIKEFQEFMNNYFIG